MAGKTTSVVIVGAGGIARWHVQCMQAMGDAVRIAGFVEIADKSRGLMTDKLKELGAKAVPPFYRTIKEFLAGNKGPADFALIATPHSLHISQIVECMRAGMDVLVEKPMVLSAAEARKAMKVRDETGRLLSVAFPGSYSPSITKAKELIAAGEIGEVRSIAAYVYQCWKTLSTGTWRQVPEISGGGFIFDTGSHTVNTMIELAGSDIKSMQAMQDNAGAPVDITTVASGRFKNGIFFTLCGEGDSINCQNRIMVVGTKGALICCNYGGSLKINKPDKWEEPVPFEKSKGVVEQFLRVRNNEIPNPCPAEVGLRFAKFMDMLRKAAAK